MNRYHFEWLQRCLNKHLQDGAAQRACTRTANTCANLLKIESALWHFLKNPAVPPTNNAAERALRGFVIKRKLSFFTRSGRGLRFLERIFSTVQTCALQGRQTFGFLQEAIDSWPARPPRHWCPTMSWRVRPAPDGYVPLGG